MKRSLLLLLLPLLLAGALSVRAEVQTDWSAGPGLPGPVGTWGARFDSSIAASWRAVPGQVALTATPLATAVSHTIDDDQTVAGGMCAADIDGDGNVDVLSTAYEAIYWWKRVGGSWTGHVVVPNFPGIASGVLTGADIDGDGDTDIAAGAYYGPTAQQENGRYAWFENLAGNGSTWTLHPVADLFYGASDIRVADIDGDGDLDIAGCSYLNYSLFLNKDVAWFENVGGAGDSWTVHTIDGDFFNATGIAILDVDGDGDLDLVGASASLNGNTIVWWGNPGTGIGTWHRHVIAPFFFGAFTLDAGDIDGDGDGDVVASSHDTHEVAWWANVGPGGTSWAQHPIATFFRAVENHVFDIDGDGVLDVLVASGNLTNSEIRWFRNVSGNGLGWSTHTVATALADPSTWAADVNQDGKLEVLGSYLGSGQGMSSLFWWDVSQFLGSGQLMGSILDGGPSNLWGTLDYDVVVVPPTTSLTVEVRAADDPQQLGAWHGVASGAALADVIDPGARYLQYRVLLGSVSGGRSPILRQIAVGSFAAPGGRVLGLSLQRRGGGDLELSWGASCAATDDDFAVFEGAIPLFGDWSALSCTTGGVTDFVLTPPPGSSFYLIAPHNGSVLGSYGLDSSGAERVPPAEECYPQQINACD